MEVITRLESNVRGYVRSFPRVFATARGNRMTTSEGEVYLDFFSGAGALNFGHNDVDMESALLDYIREGGVNHGLDMATQAQETFLQTLDEVVLKPRGMDYRIQFPGPAGTIANEAALKLARKIKGRDTILHFTRSFHGMTLGSMAVTSNGGIRESAGVGLLGATTAPYCDYYQDGRNTADDLEAMLSDPFSGIDKPAAIIVETVQGEGGIYVAGFEWLRQIERICRDHDLLLIVDDIQAGVGRTGPFFSFEPAAIRPDIITLAKSLSGMGMPLAVTLIRPELDIWEPGEHTGTFRGNNHAFVAGTTMLNKYWRDDKLEKDVIAKGEYLRDRLSVMVADQPDFDAQVRGRGLFTGLACRQADTGNALTAECFKRGLIMETTGEGDSVVKVMPPLISTDADIDEGLGIIEHAIRAVIDSQRDKRS